MMHEFLNELVEHDGFVFGRLASGRSFRRATGAAGGEEDEEDQAYEEAHAVF
jgi:hypothetical protein